MVQELDEADLPVKIFRTDDNLFQVKCRGFSLGKFEDKLSSDKVKANPEQRDNMIDKWFFYKVKSVNKLKGYKREDFLLAVDVFKKYLFGTYLVGVQE